MVWVASPQVDASGREISSSLEIYSYAYLAYLKRYFLALHLLIWATVARQSMQISNLSPGRQTAIQTLQLEADVSL